ncbi:unnamed protein product [Urochloa humidicola]
MELLDDAPAADQAAPEDIERLSRVIRSLEAEIGGGGGRPPPSAPAADGGGSTAEHVPAAGDVGSEELENMFSDLDCCFAGPCVAAEAPFEYWTTTEMPPALGHEMGGWYGDGVVVGYEFREQCYYGYSESPHFEHVYVYSPLWE